jgi:hypothetical protein
MPLILVPYTLGSQLPAAPTVVGGGAYSVRKRRYMAYMTAMLACLVVLGC